MITGLIRGKYFNRYKLLRKYRRVIIDGTGLFYFKEKHCGNCLCTTRTTEDGKQIKMYYYKVVETKIVLHDKVVISIGTEFIENENENVSKQDYELNVAKRLFQKIKKIIRVCQSVFRQMHCIQQKPSCSCVGNITGSICLPQRILDRSCWMKVLNG